ncbi:hypothetical protein D3C80_1887280 [compost metagenome]
MRLALSEEGHTLADQLPQIGAAAMNELLGILAPDELASLEGLLTKVLLAAGDTLTALRTAAAQPSISEHA